MTSVVKNGQPSMEEILASIRRIVADDPSGAAPLIDLNRKTIDRLSASVSGGVGVDDSPDFELPSMFRPDGQSARPGQLTGKLGAIQKSAPIGRLTDAIRNVGPKVVAVGHGLHNVQSPKIQTRTSKPKPKQADAGFGIQPNPTQSLSSLETNGAPGQSVRNGTVTSLRNGMRSSAEIPAKGNSEVIKEMNGSTSELNAVHHISQPAEQISAQSQMETVQAAQVDASPTTETPEKPVVQMAAKEPAPSQPRVMAPFHDTRMSMMVPRAAGAKPTKVSAPEPVQTKKIAQPKQTETKVVASSDIGAIVPSTLDLPGRGHEGATAAINGSGSADYSDNTAPQAPQQVADAAGAGGANVQTFEAEANPPPIPEERVGPKESDTKAPQQIEDATADLLRPMLRQWLSDNMPRMVEKALHIEVAETVRTGKPTDVS